jgi:oligoribonuclease (3'-5' exoribonuclease)
MSAPALICVSVVTTGLSPDNHRPLEIGLLAIERGSFEPVGQLVNVLHVDPSSALEGIDEKVVNMHMSNGLIGEMFEALSAKFDSFSAAAKAADTGLAMFVDDYAGGDSPSPLICFGVDWTHRWLRRWFPVTAGRLRGEVDVTTLLGLGGRRRPDTDGRALSNLAALAETIAKVGKALR